MAERLVPVRLLTAQDLDSGGSVTTPVIDCRKGSLDHCTIQIVQGSGDADVKIEAEISDDGVTFNTSTSQDAVIASTATEWSGQNPEDLHSFLVTATASFIRLKITELATLNNNSITLVGYLKEI